MVFIDKFKFNKNILKTLKKVKGAIQMKKNENNR
jgi:hypothetical protein